VAEIFGLKEERPAPTSVEDRGPWTARIIVVPHDHCENKVR